MIKKLGLTTIVLSIALLSGCGGSSKKSKSITEQISEKDYVVIAHNNPNGSCETLGYQQGFAQAFQEEGLPITNIITHEADNTASCAIYGRSSNCESILYDEVDAGNVACVIGFDFVNHKNLKIINSLDISDIVITSTLQIM